ncbi:DUF2867 domain-containing protein [Polaribacter butkevichii]|uniref:DUF2867 domain-containing protein n=1 Tax=Polaribacter butkevichii TaxID=218490 RepID=A0A2P6CAN6_9FLAO|nr:DUF2867 domain-containing protein [Polaribacter butkevichii]PQJ71908.1 hypothetical protein BTO14_00975 [Polaribacter butkevichii]
MKKVKEEKQKLSDELYGLLTTVNFTDTFSTTNHIDDITTITNLIFNNSPKWLELLFTLRNKLVHIIGLKTNIPEDYNETFKIGGYVKFFKIFSISDCQVILGADDSHLNFRAIVKKDASISYNIKVITLVEFNNKTGKYYMNIIKPFHRLVVKQMVKKAFKKRL